MVVVCSAASWAATGKCRTHLLGRWQSHAPSCARPPARLPTYLCPPVCACACAWLVQGGCGRRMSRSGWPTSAALPPLTRPLWWSFSASGPAAANSSCLRQTALAAWRPAAGKAWTTLLSIPTRPAARLLSSAAWRGLRRIRRRQTSSGSSSRKRRRPQWLQLRRRQQLLLRLWRLRARRAASSSQRQGGRAGAIIPP